MLLYLGAIQFNWHLFLFRNILCEINISRHAVKRSNEKKSTEWSFLVRGCEKIVGHFQEIAQGPFQERRGRRVCSRSLSVENLDTTQT